MPPFLFKVAVPKSKTKKRHSDSIVRESNKLVEGKVFIDDNGIYKIAIPLQKDITNPDLRVLVFTERSYDLTDRRIVFDKKLDKRGLRVRYIRNERDARFMPGTPEKYVPFAPNWIVKGYIVRDNGIVKFDFKGLIKIEGYNMDCIKE